METSLHDQELLLVDKSSKLRSASDLKHGDVVVFLPPTEKDRHYIKRVIGVPGDTINFAGNKVYRNGALLEEAYTNCSRTESKADFPAANASPCNYSYVEGKSFTVPAEHFFVMGDNRDVSADSRQCFGKPGCQPLSTDHFVSFSNIQGKAWVVLWPLDKFGGLADHS